MKNLYNAASLIGHLNSRQPLAEGQLFLDQMNARCGHTIYQTQVRGQKIPTISNLSVRSTYLKDDPVNPGKRVVNLPSQYSQSVMKFVDKVKIALLTEPSNNQSYQIMTKDQNGDPVLNLIMPTDCPISETQMSEGYAVKLYGKDDKEISPSLGWTVNPLNGIIHFQSNFYPGSPSWIAAGFGNDLPRVECFYYTGQMVSDKLSEQSIVISGLQNQVHTNWNQSMMIVPISFSTEVSGNPPSSSMAPVGTPYHKLFAYPQLSEINVNFQTYKCIVPGYVLNVISLQTGENINCKIKHLKDSNDTEISVDLPFTTNGGMPLSGWRFDQQYLAMYPSSLILDHTTDYSFIATTLLKRNGEKIIINWNEPYQLSCPGDLQKAKSEYLINSKFGWALPNQCCGLCRDDVLNKYDQSVNINVNLSDI